MSAETTAWQALEAELDAWAGAGRRAQVWWRDDDATAPSVALERLLALAEVHRAPLALAVIPARAGPALAACVATATDVAVLQHGYAHENHAPAGAKKCELVDPGARPTLTAELENGRERLGALFGPRLLTVMVPPWNRIAPALALRLPALGFTGLSTYRARTAAEAAPGLCQVNTQADILQWHPQRRFLGTVAALDLLTGHLAAKRRGAADPDEPSGILSHHAVHDEAAWRFLDALLAHLARHPAVQLLPAAEAFAPAARRAPA